MHCLRRLREGGAVDKRSRISAQEFRGTLRGLGQFVHLPALSMVEASHVALENRAESM